jgi:arginyl-tRNA synthetase
MQAEGAVPEGPPREPPRDPAHGDMATNAAMVLAKPAGQKPRDIAEALAPRWPGPRIADRRGRGAGFLNLRLAPEVWHGLRGAGGGRDFGRSTMGQGRRVNVEYVSANPTGPLHVGHTRGAVFGDALASCWLSPATT